MPPVSPVLGCLPRSCPRVGPRGNDMIMFLFLIFYIDSVVFCCVTVSIIPVRIWGWGVPASIHPSGCWSQRKAQKVLQLKKRVTYPLAEPVPQKRQGWGRAPLSHWWCTW